MKTVVGRTDSSASPPDGYLPAGFGPNSSHDVLYQLFLDKGFSAKDLAALIGAHSTSKAFTQQANGIPVGGKSGSAICHLTKLTQNLQVNKIPLLASGTSTTTPKSTARLQAPTASNLTSIFLTHRQMSASNSRDLLATRVSRHFDELEERKPSLTRIQANGPAHSLTRCTVSVFWASRLHPRRTSSTAQILCPRAHPAREISAPLPSTTVLDKALS